MPMRLCATFFRIWSEHHYDGQSIIYGQSMTTSITGLFIVRLEAFTRGGLKIHKKRVKRWHGMMYL